ncbi:hypothetical protein [Hymenobacter sediminicola]|uniref:PH domain-containing protein n=1 Tax=Hymenobacter sediminicola TaxID=2761579 RepID=A0A7G7WAQ0_9BACT|nr:hypothetical protein [Hymenobacter sediminicola]QNH63443.1 hypothetical protein H4317_06515 [Hymenobacter sediminicola]
MNTLSSTGHTTLYHKRRARMERAKGLSHLFPAIVLLGGAVSILTGRESFTVLAGVELAVGAAYLLLLAREWRHLGQHPAHHERVAWLELAAAGILALEGYHIWHRHHEKELQTGEHRFHVLPWVYWVVAGWYVLLAFGLAHIYKRRHLHLHAHGFSGRLHPFRRKFAYNWADIAKLETVGEEDVVVYGAGGERHVISFAHIQDGAVHRNRLSEHAAAGMSDAKKDV